MGARGGRPALALLATMLLAAACSGSGGDDDGEGALAAEALAGNGNDAAVTPAAAGQDVADPAPGGMPDAAPGAAAAVPSGVASAVPGEGARPLPEPTEIGKGITDSVIKLGIVWADAAAYNAAGSSLGGAAGFYEPEDPKGIQQAVIDYVNETGGIRGRKVEPVWHEVLAQNAVTKSGRAQDAQAACATYTEDNEVFAFMGSGQWTEPNIVECAAESGTPYIDGWVNRTGMWLSEERADAISDFYYHLSGMTTDRRERALVASLVRQGFFGKDAKVGILVENSPSIRDGVERSLKPALRDAGVEVVDEVVYPDIIESPWQTYVLRFQSAGVTHVLFSASTAESWPTLMFMRGADSQAYRPAYGISSLPVTWLQTNAPAAQLANAKGVSWVVGSIGEEPPVVSETDQVCRQIMKKHGHPERVGIGFCDFFFFVRAALERATALTPAGMADAVESFGTGWPSGLTFGGRTSFAPSRHDGAVVMRDFAWDAGAGAMAYTAGEYEAG